MAVWGQPLPGIMRPALTPQTPETDLPISIVALRAWHPDYHHRAGLPSGVPPSLHWGGTGILTGCPSPTPFGLGLGPTNPTRMYLPSETLGFRRTRFSRVLSLLIPPYSLPYSPPVLTVELQPGMERSSTRGYDRGHNQSTASVINLSPVKFSAQGHLISELLRFL